MSVAVHVGRTRTHGAILRVVRLAATPRETGGNGDVGEFSAVVAHQAVRVAIHVAGVQIEIAVLVVVEPHGADRLPRVGQSDLGGDVGELATVIPEYRVRAVAKRDEEIEVAV